jgi:hypothetical protein
MTQLERVGLRARETMQDRSEWSMIGASAMALPFAITNQDGQ